MKTTVLILLLAASGLCAACLPAEADIQPGIRLGAYSSPGSGAVGGELLMGINRQWFFNPNVEYVFQPNAGMVAVSLDVHYDLQTSAPVYLWLGAGPTILHRSPDGPGRSTTDMGVNLLFGVGFNKGRGVIPYVQSKIVVSDDSQFALAFGVRF